MHQDSLLKEMFMIQFVYLNNKLKIVFFLVHAYNETT